MRPLPAVVLLAMLASALLCGQVSVTGRVVDENGAAVAGARLEFRHPDFSTPHAAVSDVQGRFRLETSKPGEYSLRAQRAGFFVLEKARVDLAEGPNEVSVVLNHLQEFTESVDVVYSAPVIDPAQTSDQKQLNSVEVQAIPYPASQDVRMALPMFAGVVQDAQGYLHFNGGASDQVSYTLNDFNIADPVTGILEARVSMEAVRGLDLDSGRISSAAGRGSSGSLNLETGMGDDRFRFGVTNFVPSASTMHGLVLSKWTPRLIVSGPILRGRAWFHNGFDAFYDVNTIPELARGQDRSRDLMTSNLSRLQINLRPSNILTGSYLINYLDSDNHGLDFLDPIETTLDRRRTLNMLTLRDQAYFTGGTLVELGFAASRGVLRESPKGTLTFEISPEGRRGNYFAGLARHTDREQWLANIYFRPLQGRGTHKFRAGADLQRSGFDECVTRHDYRIRREDGSVARQVSFLGSGTLGRRNFESALYVQDNWTPRDGFFLELGVRADWDQIVRKLLVSPRLSAAWSPALLKGTKFAAGFGVSNETLNLEMLTRQQDQSSVTTFYSTSGVPAVPPVTTRFVAQERPLAAPRSRTLSVSVERGLPRGFSGKASYLRRAGWNGFTFQERAGGVYQPQILYALVSQRGDRYDAVELSTRRSFAGRYEWVASYTYSRARSNAVMDYSLESPVFGPQSAGPLGWDTPHRFLTWGWAPVPVPGRPRLFRLALRDLSVSSLFETRSGFPFSVVNEENFLAGPANSRRLPTYFNINLHFEKKFRFLHYMWAWRFGLNNVTNQGNPNVVNNNIDSTSFLAYGRGQQRAWNVRLRFLGRR